MAATYGRKIYIFNFRVRSKQHSSTPACSTYKDKSYVFAATKI